MDKASKTLLLILLAMLFFAVGFIAVGIYRDHKVSQIQSGKPPVIPASK